MSVDLAESMTVSATATGRSRGNFAVLHLLNAGRFAQAAHGVHAQNVDAEYGDFYDELQAWVVATVFSAVGALDAFINEVIFEPDSHFPGERPEVVATFTKLVDRAPILERMTAVAVLKGGGAPKLGQEPGQSVVALIELRNALVHFRPEWSDAKGTHEKISKQLRYKVGFSPWFKPETAAFPMPFMNYSCAKWAVESVRDFLVEFGTANGWDCGVGSAATQIKLPPVPTRRPKNL